jgi:hypothetical protein
LEMVYGTPLTPRWSGFDRSFMEVMNHGIR